MSVPPLADRLAAAGQSHVLAFWDELTDPQRAALTAQLEAIDLPLVARLFGSSDAKQDWAALAARAVPPPAVRRAAPDFAARTAQATSAGTAALAAGKVGGILVAGGQGSRLGFAHPKGLFPIGPVSGASLFAVLLEKVLATSRRYGAAVPLYLMTSPATHEKTVAFLAEQRYFGLPPEDVRVFCQGTMPAVDAVSGKLLLADKGNLALGPDGHGGMLAALAGSGALADIARRGVEHLFYWQVDNPLTTVCDPAFIGHHLVADAEYTLQVVAKRDPRENLGSVVVIDGELRCIEYSDLNPLDDALVCKRAADGVPIFWAGSIAVHVFAAAFLARMAAAAGGLPFHVARKSVSHIDAAGRPVEPAGKNAIKFERFIFDLLPAARRALAVEVDPTETFAPVKNSLAEPVDNPATVQAQMMALHRRWLRSAGARVADDVPVEVSPLFALDAEQTQARVRPGSVFSAPTYLRGDERAR